MIILSLQGAVTVMADAGFFASFVRLMMSQVGDTSTIDFGAVQVLGSIPEGLEIRDAIAFVVNKIEPRRYGQMLKDNFDRLYREGEVSGTVMCIPTHNYQVSCPHRLHAFEEALEYITGHSDVWVTTGREIARHFLDNHYQRSLADIAARNGRH